MNGKSLFSRIVEGEVPAYKLWENSDFFLILDINPVAPGHCLLIPKAEVDYLFDLENRLYEEIWRHCRWISAVLARFTGKRIGIAVEGFGIRHAHIHLVPVEKGGDLDPCKARRADEEELHEIYQTLHHEMEANKPA